MRSTQRHSVITFLSLPFVLGIVLALGGSWESAIAQQAQPTDSASSETSTSEIIEERNVVYKTVGPIEVKADLYRPKSAEAKSVPIVMLVHGGGWSMGDKWDLMEHGRELARRGMVAISVNYRLAPGSKMEEQLGDCRAAMQWALQEAEAWSVDTSRFAVWGYSAGAHLVSLLALQPEQNPVEIACVVAGGAPCEFSFVPEDSKILNYVMGKSRLEDPQIYQRFSPLSYANKDAPEFFFFHGERDLIVPQESSRMLAEKLKSLGVPVTYVSVEKKGHIMTFLDKDVREQAMLFLEQQLANERSKAVVPKSSSKQDPGSTAAKKNVENP